MATQVASLFSLLSLRDDMTPALETSKRGLADLGGHISQVGGSLTQLGGVMTALGAPAAAGFAVAVRAATDFDEAMTNTASLLGSSREEMSDLRADILSIGGHTRAGPQAVAEAFYDIVSGVQDASTHMAILDAAIAASEAGSANLTATTSGLISVMNSYGFEANRATWVSDVLTRTVGMGVGSMDDFVNALGPAAGLAQSVGISFDDLAGSTAYLTSKGGSASQGVTQLTGIMTAFLKPNSAMTKALAGMGYESGAAALKALGLGGSIQALSSSLGGSTDQMAQALGSTEALGGAVRLLNEDAGEFASDFRQGIDGVTQSTRDIQMESAAAQFDLLKSHLDGLAITIGDTLLPVLAELVPDIIDIIDSTLEWVQGNPELVATVGMIAGALAIAGPIIAGVGLVLSGLGSIVGIVAGALTFILSPIGLVIGAVAALAAAYVTNFGGIRDFVDAEVMPRLQAFFGWLGGVWESTLRPGLEALYNWFVVDALPAIEQFVTNTVLPAISGFIDLVAGFWTVVGVGLGQAYDWFVTSGLPVIQGAIETLQGVWEGLQEALSGLWNTVQPHLQPIIDWFRNTFQYIGENYIQPVINFINDIISKAQETIRLLQQIGGGGPQTATALGTSTFTPTFGSGFAAGGYTGDGAPDETAGIVHKGEWVVPQQGALVMREGGGGGGINIQSLTVYANSYAEGREAARGFREEMDELIRARG